MKKKMIAVMMLLVFAVTVCLPVKIASAEQVIDYETVSITENKVYSFQNVSSGWYLNLRHGYTDDGTEINLYPLDTSDIITQQYVFHIVDAAKKVVMISPKKITAKYLDVRRKSKPFAEGQGICIWSADSDPVKHFILDFQTDGSFYLSFAEYPDYCIGAKSETAAKTTQTQLVVCKKTGAAWQRWYLCDENGSRILKQQETTDGTPTKAPTATPVPTKTPDGKAECKHSNFDASVSAACAVCGKTRDKIYQERLDEIWKKLGNKCFTVSGDYCKYNVDFTSGKVKTQSDIKNYPMHISHSVCTNCNNLNVLKAKWFINAFDGNQFDVKLFPKLHKNMSGGVSSEGIGQCHAFTVFSSWYAVKNNLTDKVVLQWSKSGTLTKDFILSNARVGDVIRTASGHSMIIYSIGENSYTVLDCNYGKSTKKGCLVQKRVIKYATDYYKGQSVVLDRAGLSSQPVQNGSNNTTFECASSSLTNGLYVIHQKKAEAFVLDVADQNKENGANLQLWTRTLIGQGSEMTSANQIFRVTKTQTGTYLIQSVYSEKMVDVSGGNVYSENNIQLYEKNGTKSQEFYISEEAKGYYIIASAIDKNYVLDVCNGNVENGANIWLYEKNNSDAQLFSFEKIDCKHPNFDAAVSAVCYCGTTRDEIYRERLDEIWEKLGNKCFTVSGDYCKYGVDFALSQVKNQSDIKNYPMHISHSVCKNCNNLNILKAKWFINAFDGNQFDVKLFPKLHKNMSGGVSSEEIGQCHAFTVFSSWYMVKNNLTDKAELQWYKKGKLTKEFICSNARIGDVIRTSSGHSMLIYSIDEDSYTVLDCNYGKSTKKGCLVQKRVIKYSTDYYKGQEVMLDRAGLKH